MSPKFIAAPSIYGAWIIEPRAIGDARGYFMEAYNAEVYRPIIGDVDFVQDNESRSTCGVLRGLHYQRHHVQAKLVRVSAGAVVDVIVDLRQASPTFGQHLAVELSDENHRQLFVPRGCAHGFVVMSPSATFQYKVDNVYDPSAEVTLLYNDPALAIEWPAAQVAANLSDKDMRGLPLSEIIQQNLLPDV